MFAPVPDKVRIPAPFFVSPPDGPVPTPKTSEMVVLPVPVMIRRLAPFVTSELTVNRLEELLVQVWAAVRVKVEFTLFVVLLIVNAPAPLLIVMPPAPRLSLEPLPVPSPVIVSLPELLTVMLLAEIEVLFLTVTVKVPVPTPVTEKTAS